MTQILSIIGRSDSGKTTLIEKLIPELKERGYRVGSIKHASQGFNMDREGKDSHRHRSAGAEMVVVISPDRLAVIKKIDSDRLSANMKDLEVYFRDLDLVLVEGYKTEKGPKIEVFHTGLQESPINPDDETLIAFVSDDTVPTRVPQFSMEQIRELADLIEKKYLIRR